jgi:hypothetical protein
MLTTAALGLCLAIGQVTSTDTSEQETTRKINLEAAGATFLLDNVVQLGTLGYAPLAGIYGAALGAAIVGPALVALGAGRDGYARVSYTPYIINTKRTSGITGSPASTVGWGLGQLYQASVGGEYLGVQSTVETQTTPLASNEALALTNGFFKYGAHVSAAVRPYFEAFGGYSGFMDIISVHNPIYKGGMVGFMKPLMLGNGFEGGARLSLPLGGFLTLQGSLEGATYPSLTYPALDGRSAAYIAMTGYDDLRSASSYRWYRYNVAVRFDVVAQWLTMFFGFDTSRLQAQGGSGGGVSNRGASITFVVHDGRLAL